MSTSTVKGIGYIRVSTRRQGRAWSLPGQRATIEEYAARVGIDLIAVYSDIETGITLDRTQFSDTLQRLRDGEASVLVVYALDRLSRNRPQLLQLVEELQHLGVDIHLAKQGRVMGRTADDRIADAVEAHFAEVERASFVERVANGRQAKIKRGHYPGGGQPPYGYRVEGRGSKTQLVIADEQAAIVRMIFQLFAYGDASGKVSVPEIARRLTALGLPTPGDLRKGFETTRKRAHGEWVAQSIYPYITEQRLRGALHERTLFHGGWQAAASRYWEGCRTSTGDCRRSNLASGAAAA